MILPLLSLALGMDQDTLMVFLPRGMITTSRGGPLGAKNKAKENIVFLHSYTKYEQCHVPKGFMFHDSWPGSNPG